MNAELIPLNETVNLAQIKEMSLEELGHYILEVYRRIQRDIVLIATLLPLYEAKGGNPKELIPVPHMLLAIRRVSEKLVFPELVTIYLAHPAKLNTVGALPKAEQKKLVDSNGNERRVLMVVQGGDDVMQLPSEMNFAQFKQVFGEGRIRTKEEQISYLRSLESPSIAAPERIGNIGEVDRLRQVFEIKHKGCLDLPTLKRIVRMLEG